MPPNWTKDDALVADLAGRLFGAMSMFPKRLVHIDALTKRFGMPLSQIQILALVEHEDLSISRLSVRTGIAKPNITPLVDTLCDKGYVTRCHAEGDRRRVHVHIEAEGEKCLRALREAVAEQIREWPEDLPRTSIKKLTGALETLTAVMEAMDSEK